MLLLQLEVPPVLITGPLHRAGPTKLLLHLHSTNHLDHQVMVHRVDKVDIVDIVDRVVRVVMADIKLSRLD